jgi:5-methylcytosine-specific restriction endonuclease McrA
MSADTLLLDKGYQPLITVSWQKAMCLLILGKIEVVSEYDREIRSATMAVRLPAVARLLGVLQPRAKRQVKFSKQNILARDRWQCQYCAAPISRAAMTVDHVVPRACGGRSTWENLVTACEACNALKAARTPEQTRADLLAEVESLELQASTVSLPADEEALLWRAEVLREQADTFQLRKKPKRPNWVPIFAIRRTQDTVPEQWTEYLTYGSGTLVCAS